MVEYFESLPRVNLPGIELGSERIFHSQVPRGHCAQVFSLAFLARLTSILKHGPHTLIYEFCPSAGIRILVDVYSVVIEGKRSLDERCSHSVVIYMLAAMTDAWGCIMASARDCLTKP